MVAVYLDDKLVSVVYEQSHLENLNEVLTRLEEAGEGLNEPRAPRVV